MNSSSLLQARNATRTRKTEAGTGGIIEALHAKWNGKDYLMNGASDHSLFYYYLLYAHLLPFE